MKAGLQLYSLSGMINEKGLAAVLDIVKTAGFDGVEFAGFADLSLEQVKEKLIETGLKTVGIHSNLADMTDKFDELADTCDALNTKNLVIACAESEFYADKEKFLESVKNLTENYAGRGIQVLYHNHAYEFKGGIDLLKELTAFAPKLLLEPDIFWLKASDKEPVAYLKELSGKVGIIHMKEMSALGQYDFNPIIGQGFTDAQGVKDYAKKQNIEWGVVEFEKINIETAEYIRKCCEFIKA